MAAAAVRVARLVPNVVLDEAADDDTALVRWLEPAEYRSLSTGEQAAYDIARELWIGSGPLARFLIYADQHYAETLLSAITVALGPVMVPVGARTEEDARWNRHLRALHHTDWQPSHADAQHYVEAVDDDWQQP
jgi:hypothetical protein